MEKGVPIRAISRGLNALMAINRGRSLTMMEVAQAIDVPYPTACRVVQTLLHEGFVEVEPDRKRYRPTALVHALSSGHQPENELSNAARPILQKLTQKLTWPTALTTRVGPKMIVRESTHMLTSLTYETYYPGHTMPLLATSSGKVYLAFCSETERNAIINGLQEMGDIEDRAMAWLAESRNFVAKVRTQGYAVHDKNEYSVNPGKTSSISVPVFEGDRFVAALCLFYFASAMPASVAVDRYLPDLKDAASQIGEANLAVPKRELVHPTRDEQKVHALAGHIML